MCIVYVQKKEVYYAFRFNTGSFFSLEKCFSSKQKVNIKMLLITEGKCLSFKHKSLSKLGRQRELFIF